MSERGGEVTQFDDLPFGVVAEVAQREMKIELRAHAFSVLQVIRRVNDEGKGAAYG